jgi:Pentapeptide repeats (8 copies)
MNLADARLTGAILVQAYVAADLTRADMTGANCAYSRFSQSDMRNANLVGAAMYQSTWVKVQAEGVGASAMAGPMFVDRCPGLLEALENDVNGADNGTLVSWLRSLRDLLAHQRNGST